MIPATGAGAQSETSWKDRRFEARFGRNGSIEYLPIFDVLLHLCLLFFVAKTNRFALPTTAGAATTDRVATLVLSFLFLSVSLSLSL